MISPWCALCGDSRVSCGRVFSRSWHKLLLCSFFDGHKSKIIRKSWNSAKNL